jgi:precorrin-6B methylase 2
VNPVLPSGARVRTLPAGPARGVRMEIDFAYQLRFYLGVFERELVPWYRRFCVPGTRAFDIGAREGYVTLLLAKLSQPSGRVAAFEMDETEHTRLRRNIEANPQLRSTAIPVLIRVTEHVEPGVRTTIDEAAYEQQFVPDFIKVDVEGTELKVLRAATRVLSERRPHLVVETHSPELEHDCAALLTRHGYEPRVVEPRSWLPEVREGHNRWLVAEGAALP